MVTNEPPARRAARFVFISDIPTHRFRDGDDLVVRVWWRLAAANNRVLGRSAGSFADLAACRRHAAALHAGAAHVTTAMLPDSRGHWSWSVSLEAQPAAISAHPFLRRVDCVRTLDLFLSAARTASTTTGELRHYTARGPSEPMDQDERAGSGHR